MNFMENMLSFAFMKPTKQARDHERFASLLAGARPFENLFTNLQAPGPSRPGPNLTAHRQNSKSGGHNGEGLEGQHRLGTAKRSNGAKRAEIGNRDVGCAGQVGQLLVGHGGQKMKEFGIREIIVVFSIIGAKPMAHGRFIRARVRCNCRQGLWLSHDDLGRRRRTSYGIGEHRSGD